MGDLLTCKALDRQIAGRTTARAKVRIAAGGAQHRPAILSWFFTPFSRLDSAVGFRAARLEINQSLFHRTHQCLCGRQVRCHWHVMYVADAQEGRNVGIVWLGGEWIAQEDDEIHLVVRNHRANLLVAAIRTGLKAVDGQSCCLMNATSRGSGCKEIDVLQNVLVRDGQVYNVVFLVVMRYQCYVHRLASSAMLHAISV